MEVKYVFRNLYNIKDPSIFNDGNVVFLGFGKALADTYLYAGFSNETAVYNEIYPFSRAKSEFLKTTFIYLGLVLVLTLMVETMMILIYRKQEMASLYKDLISGSKAAYFQSLVFVNLLLHLLSALIASTVLSSIGCYLSAVTILSTVSLLVLIKCVVLRIQIH